MRKNYFAKKFVAYSMAFAVAFSTLTVSPVFVKEAKAAGVLTVANGFATPDNYASSIIVGGINTKLGTTDNISVTDLKALAGFNSAEDIVVGAIDSNNEITYGGTPTTASVNKIEPVAFNGKVRKDEAGATRAEEIGNKVFSYTSNVQGASWYKLVPRTKEDVTYQVSGATEKLTVPYYILEAASGVTAADTEVVYTAVTAGTTPYSSSTTYYKDVAGTKTAVTETQIKDDLFDNVIVDGGNFKTGYDTDLTYQVYTKDDGDTYTAVTAGTTPYSSSTTYYKDVAGTKTAVTETQMKDDLFDNVIVDGGNFKTGYNTKLTYQVYTKGNDFVSGSYDKISFSEINADQLGVYVAIKANAVQHILVIKEVSDMNVKVSQKVVKSMVGKSAILGVDVTSTRPVTYTWTKNGKELGTSATLQLSNLTSNDFGTYSCKVSDGLKSETVSVDLSETKSTDASSTATEMTTFKNVYDGGYPTGTAPLTVETSIPTNENFVYIWSQGETPIDIDGILTSASKVKYFPTDRSVTLKAQPTDDTLTVFAVDKDAYNNLDAIKLALKNVNEAPEYDKIDKVDTLLRASFDLVDGAGDDLTVLFKETIKLGQKSSKNISEIKQAKLGETLNLTVPAIEGVNQATTYAWSGANTSNIGVINTNTLRFNALGIKDFGTYTCTLDLDGDSDTTTDVVEYVVNLVYVSDFTAEAEEIVTAKVGTKNVTFTVNASSTLPISYKWVNKRGALVWKGTVKPNEPGTVNTITLQDITTDNADTIFSEFDPEGKLKTSGLYYECTVTDGISTKVFNFGVKKSVGFTVSGNKTLEARKDTNVTLDPSVKLSDSDSVTYKWYKGASKTVISTDSTYTFNFDGTDGTIYKVEVTDGVQTEEVTFTVNKYSRALDYTHFEDVVKDVVYTGEAQDGNLQVIASDYVADPETPATKYLVLEKDKDYTVDYKENINVGVARYTITFKGDFESKKAIEGSFYIDRADNEVTVADKTVVLGGSVQPKTTNKAGAAVTYTYYADEACTTALEAAPTKVGTYYVKATSIATTNYNEATSNVATVKVVPGKVKMLGTSRTASSVKLNWNKTTGATSYRVFYKAAGAKSYKVFKNTTATSMNVTGLASATTYTFAVKAYAKTAGYSTVYATKQTTTAPAKVAKPTVTAGSKKATVKFTKVARATGYQVYMAKGNGSYKKVATTKSLSFTKIGLAKGATYKFKVRAYKTVGSNTYYGAFSSAKAVVVK